MIPRTKVNYSFRDVFRAIFISRKSDAYVIELKRLLSQYLGAKEILFTSSGRCGLYFILKSIPKDTVILPSYTCNAVVEASILAGKKVIYCEVSPDDFNLDLNELEKIVDRNSIVIATHQFGFPCDIKKIMDICQPLGAFVVEDVAAAFGTRIDGQLAGSFGHAAFFSFDSTKLINVPMKGGFVISKDEIFLNEVRKEYFQSIKPLKSIHKILILMKAFLLLFIENKFIYRLFHWFYFESREKVTTESVQLKTKGRTFFYLYDFTNWQAYFAVKQISRLNEIVLKRQECYSYYVKHLSGLKSIKLPPVGKHKQWACIRFPVRVRGNKFSYYKEAVRKGVDFAFSFTYIVAPKCYDNAHAIADSILDLPFYNKLHVKDMDYIIKVLAGMDSES